MKEEPRFSHAKIPMKSVGPVKIVGPEVDDEVMIPLATYEVPLWPSVNRGARVSVLSGGLRAVVVDERMARSVLLEAPNAETAVRVVAELAERKADLGAVVEASDPFATFVDMHSQIVGNLLYLRFEMKTGDASGQNMVTVAADRLIEYILERYPEIKYVSISANYCTDKKPSAVNGILGRGRSVIVEAVVPRKVCREYLKTTPEKVVDLNIKKNLLGTSLAGGIRSANAHFANMLLGFYLATGQDAANIVEGSQGYVHAEAKEDGLYFSVTVPHLIVGTVGNGKNFDFVLANLEGLGCLEKREPGLNGRRLAVIMAAAVWCGELSLLAAQTNPGELMRAHVKYERNK